jgi:hypothetical protein
MMVITTRTSTRINPCDGFGRFPAAVLRKEDGIGQRRKSGREVAKQSPTRIAPASAGIEPVAVVVARIGFPFNSLMLILR